MGILAITRIYQWRCLCGLTGETDSDIEAYQEATDHLDAEPQNANHEVTISTVMKWK